MNRRSITSVAWWPVLVITMLGIITTPGAAGSPVADVVERAYQLRMDGKAIEARDLLMGAMTGTNADADLYFELARGAMHRGLSDPREIAPILEEAEQHIEKAGRLDPSETRYDFFRGQVKYFHAYLALQRGGDNVVEKVHETCEAFEQVLSRRPDCTTARLYLVELYGSIPQEQGGDVQRAEAHRSVLKDTNEILALKAESILGEVAVAEWEALSDAHPMRADVLEEWGKALLAEDEFGAATECFAKAIAIDPGLTSLWLDLGRYHFYVAMGARRSGDDDALAASLSEAARAFERYLSHDANGPMVAYAHDMLAKVKSGQGAKDEAATLRERAARIDPFHSRATGVPPQSLFTPPDVLPDTHAYLLRPW